ncbi:MAG: MOSC N-terminal beta barrel domain-containing protein, partial [Gemmatimonadetes bacterium]|nr:MOSC N-terminal beta barrel domain-containing protein [Gemmatimonadota bacterium]
MRITQLNVYPLKGAAGISVGVWQLDGFGLRYDRRWMVVDGVGTFISQRSDAGLGQVRPSFAAGSLALHSGTSGECRLPLSG